MDRPIVENVEAPKPAIHPAVHPAVHSAAQPSVQSATQSAVQPNAKSVTGQTASSPTKGSGWKPAIIGVVGISALLVVGGLPRILQQRHLLDQNNSMLSQAPPASILIAKSAPPMDEFNLPGSTQAIQDAPIYSRVDGYLRERFVDIGDKVHKGQVLADIDTPELDKQVQTAQNSVDQAEANVENASESLAKAQADEKTAAANVRKARTDVQYAQIEFNRYKKLAEQGAVSLESRDQWVQNYNGGVASLEAAISSQKSAEAAVRSAQAAIRVANSAKRAAQSQHDQYDATRSFRHVTAMFDGTVTKRNVDAGALITSGSNTSNNVLFEIAKTDILRIFANVPEQYVSEVHVGEDAGLKFQAYPGKVFTGRVSNVAGGLDPDSKTLQVEIQIDNAQHKLLPGMFANVVFRSKASNTLPIIPASCVQTRAAGIFVYTLDANNRVKMHKVTVGRDLGGQLEIENGVDVGDRVVVNPPDEINDGTLVHPVMAKLENKAGG